MASINHLVLMIALLTASERIIVGSLQDKTFQERIIPERRTLRVVCHRCRYA